MSQLKGFHCAPPLTHLKIWLIEGHIEGQSKCNQEQNGQEQKSTEGVEDTNKHHDIDSSQWQVANEDDEINPTKKYG